MRGCIGFFLFVFLVFPVLVVFEGLAAASVTLLNREFYTEAFASPEVYNVILDGVLSEASGTNASLLRENGDYERLAATLNDAEWRAAVDLAVDQLFDVVEGRATSITITLPLAPFKVLLQSSTGAAFARDYAEHLRDCRFGEEPTTAPYLVGLSLPTCLPAGDLREPYIQGFIERLPIIAENMPASLTYTNPLEGMGIAESIGGMGLNSIISGVVVAFGVLAVGLWFANGLIASGSVRGKMMWLGVTLVIPSLVLLLFGLLFSTALLQPGAARVGADAELSHGFTNVIFGLGSNMMQAFLAAGGIPSVVGALLFTIGLVIPARRRDDAVSGPYTNPTTQYAEKPKNSDPLGKLKNDDFDPLIRP